MGLTMEFHVGPAKDLAQAFCDAEFDRLEAISLGLADFSLHLSPSDLDPLAEELCKVAGHSLLAFTDVAHELLAGDRAESGVFLISDVFVSMVASIPGGFVSDIAERWMARVADESGQPEIGATADTVLAVSDLLRLCRKAKDESLELVYCWSL